MARVEICESRGAVCTITSGGLPAFPDWFESEVSRILARLQDEEKARQVADPAAEVERLRSVLKSEGYSAAVVYGAT